MDRDFWLKKWRENQIGFHQPDTNAFLRRHWTKMRLRPGARVFAPLCGKSHDMLWLRAQGMSVVGVELARNAVEQFFEESGLTPVVSMCGAFERFEVEGLALLVGDIFDLDALTLGRVDATYDRAALIALPEPMRARYADRLLALAGHAPQLLVTVAYDQAMASGPPFSVGEEEIRSRYGDRYEIKTIEWADIPGGFRKAGPATETSWLLTPR
ncbi:thiopurine S-methyltransferase [Acetobacter sp. DsW_063]|uniref:thiopurine S-methyltransferase n=1 Tax=Acetobacter sp. DsW_063 TaxID=1514894 RepID=UPI000A363512|nr:thiopurine S-methyltransferase [Acetobacter sp. DsW_063]OUJ14324.1 thiopurine S-methyltransferase [Acetobacter sp. DsW_063]